VLKGHVVYIAGPGFWTALGIGWGNGGQTFINDEYRTSLVYKGWQGSAVKNSYRINATYSIPVG